MSDIDLKTRVEILPCGKCEEMIGCDNCLFAKEAKDLYQQIRADAIDKFVSLVNTTWLFRGKDGKPYREEIKSIAEQLKEK